MLLQTIAYCQLCVVCLPAALLDEVSEEQSWLMKPE